MTPMQIKICGVTNVRDAEACVDLGAQLIGLNFWPQSPRYIQPDTARQVVDALPSEITAVGVYDDGNAEEIRKPAQTPGARCVQLHGNFTHEAARELAREFGVIQQMHTHAQVCSHDVAL